MVSLPSQTFLSKVVLDPDQADPMYWQLNEALRNGILHGFLSPGQRLPATRVLAKMLKVSRNTVILAFEQLFAEGYLEGRRGSGTFVVETLPEDLLVSRRSVEKQTAQKQALKQPTVLAGRRAPSKRGLNMATTRISSPLDPSEVRPFYSGMPNVSAFPTKVWARLLNRELQFPRRRILGYGEAGGYEPLRKVVASYLKVARSVQCEPEQIIIVSGAQQGLDLASRVLLDPKDKVWIEDPAYLGIRGVLMAAGAEPVPVPIDDEGLQVDIGNKVAPNARMAYVTPSYQYPLGVVMSATRRLELLEWANQAESWILEDDYDSEYRYAGRPLGSLQGLDVHQRVIYLGTFSKVLFPALRLGYLVVPADLVDTFTAARAILDRHSPILSQAVLTRFIEEGHFERHIRKTRILHQERQQDFLEICGQYLKGAISLNPSDSGLHIVGWLNKNQSDIEVAEKARKVNVTAPPLSLFKQKYETPAGLVLGYAAYKRNEMEQAAQRLAGVFG